MMNAIQEHERAHHCRVILAELEPAGPAEVVCVPVLGSRELLVDVWNCRAHFGEMVNTSAVPSTVHWLDEEGLTRTERRKLEQLKERIVYDERGAAINLNGHYRPATAASARTLHRLVQTLEHRAGAHALRR